MMSSAAAREGFSSREDPGPAVSRSTSAADFGFRRAGAGHSAIVYRLARTCALSRWTEHDEAPASLRVAYVNDIGERSFRVIKPLFDKPVVCRILPFLSFLNQTMLHRIEMDVIDMSVQIALIPYTMLPESRLPKGTGMPLTQAPCKLCLNQAPSC